MAYQFDSVIARTVKRDTQVNVQQARLVEFRVRGTPGSADSYSSTAVFALGNDSGGFVAEDVLTFDFNATETATILMRSSVTGSVAENIERSVLRLLNTKGILPTGSIV